MITAFKAILIIIIIISFMGAVAEQKPDLRAQMTLLCLAAMAATVTVFIFI